MDIDLSEVIDNTSFRKTNDCSQVVNNEFVANSKTMLSTDSLISNEKSDEQ